MGGCAEGAMNKRRRKKAGHCTKCYLVVEDDSGMGCPFVRHYGIFSTESAAKAAVAKMGRTDDDTVSIEAFTLDALDWEPPKKPDQPINDSRMRVNTELADMARRIMLHRDTEIINAYIFKKKDC
jgi:hypothetical protein